MNDKTIFSKKFALMIAIVLPALMLVASPMTPFATVEVFAQEESAPDAANVLDQLYVNSETQRETDSNGPAMMTSVNSALNLVVDVDVVNDEEDCEDANDQTNQEISQSTDQYGKASDPYPVIGTSVQTGANIDVTPDFVLTDACGPIADEATKTISQSSNQQGEGDRYFTSVQDARNIGFDTNVYAPVFD